MVQAFADGVAYPRPSGGFAPRPVCLAAHLPTPRLGARPIYPAGHRLYSEDRSEPPHRVRQELRMTAILVFIIGTVVRLVVPAGLLLLIGTWVNRPQGSTHGA
jgi:hypothetical protein